LATSTKTEIDIKEPKCTICDYTFFKVERVSPDKIRLTCENCGEKHLIVIKSEDKNKSRLKFIDAEENTLETS
jgi:hypothetical protein